MANEGYDNADVATAGLVTRLKKVALNVQRAAGLVRFHPFDTSTSEGRSQERHRRVVLTASAAATARLVSIATAIVSVPLTLNYLGPERYGMWMTMSSLIVLFAFADLGIGYGIMNVVADSNGRDDPVTIRSATSNGLLILTIIGVVILVSFAVAYPFVPWFAIFNVKSEVARLEAGPALAVVVVCFALAIPLGVAQRVQMGLQQGFIANLWRCLGSVLGLIGVLIVIWLKGGLFWLVMALLGGPLVASITNTLFFFRSSGRDLAPQRLYFSRRMAARIARTGLLFFGLHVAMAVTITSDNIIIAQKLGAEAVTNFAVPDKMFGLIGVAVGIVLQPLWPAYGEAIARGDSAWVRATLLRSVSAAIVVTGALSLFLIIFGAQIIELWTGPAVKAPFMLFVGLGLWKIIESGDNAVAMLLNGANVIRFQLILAAVMAAIAISLKLVLVNHIGISGVVWATVLANLTTLPATFWFVRRWLRERDERLPLGRVAE